MAKTTFKQSVSNGYGRLKSVAGDVYTDVTSHWRKPGKGNFLSYKEIANYSVGGMGVNMIAFFIGHLGFGAASMLLAASIGLRPMHLQTMATIQTIVNVFFYAIRGKIVDNTRTKWGRFRPYIAVMGVPLVILSTVFLFLPFETMKYTDKLILTFAFGISVSMLTPLLTDTFGELGSCMSPNTAERTKMFTIYSLFFSIAPTIYNFFIPILSDFTGGYTNIATYRYIIAPVGIMGLALVLFAAFGCKERIVTSNSYVQKVGMLKGCVAVWKNKYWWIRTVSGFVGFLEGANGVLFSWIYIYSTQDMTTYAFLTTIMGSASGIAMFITPFLLSKLGNRKMLLYHNAFNILMVIGMLATYQAPLLFFLFMYLNSAVNNTAMVYSPVNAAEVKDSIQYQSGLRLDFTLGAAGMITLPITIATGYAIPFIYEAMGLTFNFNVLYDPLIRNNLFYVLCVLSIIGAALNLIPFFFYTLSREKHRTIYAALKFRQANSNYATGSITSREVKETVDLYNEMMGYYNAEAPDIKSLKKAVREAKKIKAVTAEMKASPDWANEELRADMIAKGKAERKAAIKEARKAFRDGQRLKEYKDSIDEIFIPELKKFDQPLMIAKVDFSSQVAMTDINQLLSLKELTVAEQDTDEKLSKRIAKQTARMNKQLKKMQRVIARRFPNGVTRDYWKELEDALNATPTTKEEKALANRNIKKAKKAYKNYRAVYKFYYDCKELKGDYDSRSHYDNYINAMYDDAAKEVAVLDAEDLRKERAATAMHKAEIFLIKSKKAHAKTEKLAANNAKKNGQPYTIKEFDPADYGIDENGYALKKTGDELQSITDLIAANKNLKKAQKTHAKLQATLAKQAKNSGAEYTATPFNSADYGLDELGYSIESENKED